MNRKRPNSPKVNQMLSISSTHKRTSNNSSAGNSFPIPQSPTFNQKSLDFSCFPNLPPQTQLYILQSLASSCSKSTISSLVSCLIPALKLDFISNLPFELSFQILLYLPTKSLLLCSSVSCSWRHVINGRGSELAIWKRRLQQENWINPLDLNSLISSPWTIQNPPPHLYKSLFKKYHTIQQNWYSGEYRHISFPAHSGSVVTCLQFDDDIIVSGSDDHSVQIFNTKSGSLLQRLSGHQGGVWALQYWKHILVSGSTDRSIRIWNIPTGQCNHIFEGHTSTVRCLLILPPDPLNNNPDNPKIPLIITGSRDSTLRIWKLPDPLIDPPFLNPHATSSSNPYFCHLLSGHTGSVRAIAASGNTLVSGSYDTTVRVWNISTGKCRFTFLGHREKVYSVGYCEELKRAVSGSMDATVRIWCTTTGVSLFILEGMSFELFNYEGHTSLVGLLEISPKYIVSAAADSTLRIWCPQTGACFGQLTGHSAAITCFHHDAGKNRIVSGSDGGIKVWELSSISYGTRSIPSNSPLASALVYSQGQNGREPIHGRFVRDLITSASGIWRICMDAKRLVAAVSREGGGTWFEVLDFSDDVCKEHVMGEGDTALFRDAMDEDEDDDSEQESEDHNLDSDREEDLRI